MAQGFTHIEWVDFHESFSHVAKWVTVRVLIHLATVNRWSLHQANINNPFVHGFLNEETIHEASRRLQKGKAMVVM